MDTATQQTAKTVISHAADCICQALDTWNATDLDRIAGAQQLLELAVEDLRRATERIGQDPSDRPRELQQLVESLRRDVNRMSKIVDASSAFQNGMAVRLGTSGVAYDTSGSVPLVAPPPDGIEV